VVFDKELRKGERKDCAGFVPRSSVNAKEQRVIFILLDVAGKRLYQEEEIV